MDNSEASLVKDRNIHCINTIPNFYKQNIITKSPIELTEQSNRQDNSLSRPIIVYYFDFECLPESLDKSQKLDLEILSNQEPPYMIESFSHIGDDKKVCIQSIQMKRTKKAFNFYKCILDQTFQSFKISQNINNNVSYINDTSNSINHLQGTDQNSIQHQIIEIQNSINDAQNIEEQNKHSENTSEIKERQTTSLLDLKNNLQKNNGQHKEMNDNQHQNKQKDSHRQQFVELVFENPFYQSGEFQNNIQTNNNDMNTNNKQNIQNSKQKKIRLVIYDGQLIEVKERKQNKINLIITTDLGGTLCGISAATKQFMHYWIQYFYFDKSSKLIYNSGRGIHPFQLIMKEEKLVLPDFYIGRCGSFIYLKDQQKGYLYQDKDWLHELSQSWNPQIIQEQFNKLSSWLTFKIRNEGEVWSLRYFTDAKVFQEHIEEFKSLEKELKDKGIYFNSVQREKQNVMHIEIVPFITDKGFALDYLLHKAYFPNIQNIDSSIHQKFEYQNDMKPVFKRIYEQVNQMNKEIMDYKNFLINKDREDLVIVSFGDTMNDEGMFRVSNLSICVQNSEQQLINWVESQQQQQPNLKISNHKNAYALIDFILQYI